MSNPRVYVGTYRKYNNGSIAGGWVSLRDCRDYQTFLGKCRSLHRGERDPEYMIQDREDFPDGLNCGDWLSETDFNDIIEACREEDAGEGETLFLAEQLRFALLTKIGRSDVNKDDEKSLMCEYMREWAKVWKDDKSMLDYERKRFSGAVRLQNGGILFFEKPSMKTEFCFGYSSCGQGQSYDEAREEERLAGTEDYFLHANLDDMDGGIKALECNCRFPDNEYHSRYYGKTWYIQRLSYDNQKEPLNLWTFRAWREYDVDTEPWRYTPGTYEKMTDTDRHTILGGLRRERGKFEKRLRTYLKRYGTSKLRTWTYWMDE